MRTLYDVDLLTIFILRELQEKYLANKNDLHFALADLEKAYDQSKCFFQWWLSNLVRIRSGFSVTTHAYNNVGKIIYGNEIRSGLGVG